MLIPKYPPTNDLLPLLHFIRGGGSEPASALSSVLFLSGLRMAVSLPQSWRVAMTRKLMSPTCPITTWSPSRQTFWTESPLGSILPQSLTAGSAAVHCTSSRPRLDGAGGDQGWHCCQAHAAARICEARQGLQQAGVRFQSPVQPAAAAEGSSLSAPHRRLAAAFLGHTPHHASVWRSHKCLQDYQCKGRMPRALLVPPLLLLLSGEETSSWSSGPGLPGPFTPHHPSHDKRTK